MHDITYLTKNVKFMEKMFMKTQKMIKTAKVLEKVFRILQWVVIVCAVVVLLVLCIFKSNLIQKVYSGSVDIGNLTFTLKDGEMPKSIVSYAWVMVIGAIAYCAIFYYLLGVFRKILKPMTEGNPFAPTVSKEIRKLAFAGLAIGIVYNVMSFIATTVAVHIFDLSTLLQSSQISGISTNFHFDVTFVILFFVLLLVSYIFQYGEELQKLSDETL